MRKLDECQQMIFAQATRFTIAVFNISFVIVLFYHMFAQMSERITGSDLWFIFLFGNLIICFSDLYYRKKYDMKSSQLVNDETDRFLRTKTSLINLCYLIVAFLIALWKEVWLKESIAYTLAALIWMILLFLFFTLLFAFRYGYLPFHRE